MNSNRWFALALGALIALAVGALLLMGRGSRERPAAEPRAEAPRAAEFPAEVPTAPTTSTRGTTEFIPYGVYHGPIREGESTAWLGSVQPAARETSPVSRVHLMVLEEGTREPLERVTISLVSRDGGETVRLETDKHGAAFLSGIAPGAYNAEINWGRMDTIEGGRVDVPEGQRVYKEFLYPARQSFRFQLVTGERPVPYRTLRIGLPMFHWQDESPILYSDVQTDSQGCFVVRGYEGMRPMIIRSAGAEMYSGEPERGWGNPYSWRWPLREGEEARTVHLRENVVRATGVLVFPAGTETPANMIATVRSPQFTYWMLGVEDNRFSFVGVPGETASVIVSRRVSPSMGLAGISREKTMQVTLPDEPGDFEFEVPFDERVRVEGVVLRPGNRGARNVQVRAVGLGTAPAEQGGGDRGRGRWMPRALQGDASYLSERTDSQGRFSLDLPPATEYMFVPEPGTLPSSAKGHSPLKVAWSELQGGQLVVIVLETSALVWGEVVDERGNPVAGARVALRGSAVDFNADDYAVTTDEHGLFTMNVPPVPGAESLPPGSSRLFVAANHESGVGYAPAIPDSGERVRVRLHRLVSGRLIVTDGGQPATEVEIASFLRPEGFNEPLTRERLRVRRNEEGRYRFDNVPRGITTFTVSRRNAEPANVRTAPLARDARNGLEIVVDVAPIQVGGGDVIYTF